MFDPETMRRMDLKDRQQERGNLQDRVGSSEARYKQRLEAFRKVGQENRHLALWLLHNCVAHPLLGLLPNKETVRLHNRTSDRLNQSKRDEYWRKAKDVVPEIPNRAEWVFHNCLVHMAIGLFPSPLTFDLHDWSADRLDVPGWV